MKQTWILFVVIFLKWFIIKKCSANDFPSLLVANASIAILLDHEYLDNEYEKTLKGVKEIIEKVLREDLTEGGVIVKYFSWTEINFNKDFTAVMSITSCKNTWKTYYKTQKETLLYIALTDTDCPRLPSDQAIMIPILTIGEELPQILLDMRSSQAINWKSAVVLYDDTFDRDTISRVINALSSEAPSGSKTISMSISMFKFVITGEEEPRYAIENVLKSFSTNYIGTNFLVIAKDPNLIIEIAGELEMVNTLSQWLLLVSDSKSIDSNISSISTKITEGGNVAVAVNMTESQGCNSGRICHFAEAFKMFVYALSKMIKEEEAIYKQISDEEWEAIRLSKKERKDGMLDYVKNHLVRDNQCSKCLKWVFKSIENWGLIYDPGNNKKNTLVKDVAIWVPTNAFMIEDTLFPHISHGFRNRTLPVVTYHNPPWQIIEYGETGEILRINGVVVYILNELSKKLNFTYELYDLSKLKNNTFWFEDNNKTNHISYQSTINIPQDVVEVITANKVFIAAAGVTIFEEYIKLFNYTRPISVQSYSLLFARPKELSRLYLFTAPFSKDTWVCLIITVIIIGPLLFGVNYITPYNEYFHIIRKGGLYKVGNCFWYIYGALLQQGGMYLPRSDSGRIIVGTWWLVVLVVVTTYCGNLVAFLTFPKIETPIKTVNQLLNNKNGITWGIRADTYLQDYMTTSQDSKFKQFKNGAKIHSNDLKGVIESVKFGKHVYIDWTSNLRFLMKQDFLLSDSCDFGLGTEEFLDERIALIMPLNSPYIKIINNEIYRMLQMGLIQKWLTEFLPKKDRCSNMGKTPELENHTVNLNDMQGCFLVLITGIVISILLMFCECLLAKKKVLGEKKIIKPFIK